MIKEIEEKIKKVLDFNSKDSNEIEDFRIEFLGKKANTASFIADIALKMDLDIIPIKIKRESNLKNSITFLNKIE